MAHGLHDTGGDRAATQWRRHSSGEAPLNLQRVLTEAYGADSLRLGVECAGFTQEADGVTAHLSDGGGERGDV